MKSSKSVSKWPGWPRLRLVVAVSLAVLCSSYCTAPDSQTTITALSPDEAYLVEAYVRVAEARDLYPISPLKSDSLFAALDSTIDSLRIANTIRDLNRDPDRWIVVFKSIERRLGTPSQGTD
jgi:hypothetical protein